MKTERHLAMKNANQALMGLAVVGLLGGSVAITAAAPADTGVELPAPSATDGESSVVTDPTTTLPETTTTSAPETTTTIPDSTTTSTTSSTTTTSVPETTTTVPGSTTTVPDSTTTSVPETSTTTTEPSAVLTLGNRVWLDANANGIQEFGEDGISGVAMSATYAGVDGVLGTADDLTLTTQTGANGTYEFAGLAPGKYRVVVGAGIPGGLVNSADPDTGLASPDGRSELNLTTSRNDQDFGFTPYDVAGISSIGDTVYADTNGNGQQDADEPGIGDVGVTLTSDAGTQTDTTDANGNYLFDDLDAGNYTVTVDTTTLPSGVVNTDDEDGNNNNTTSVVLGDDDAHLTADFGYDEPTAPLGSIGDTIFDDIDGDGVQDAGDAGISGVTVTLTGAGPDGQFGTADDTTDSVDTDGNGNYSFDDLPAGDYVVTVDTDDLPAGVVNTFDEDGNNDSSTPVSLAPGEDTDTVDFGYTTPVELGSIGDTVYLDRNGNGTQDAVEPGLPGAIVVLFGPGPDGVLGTADDTNQVATTDANGKYLFTDLPAGRYKVNVGGAVVGNLDNTGDPDGGSDSMSFVELAAGENDLDQDFGYDVENAVLGDRVWWDLDSDGVQDAGEPGINGVTVTATFAGGDGVLGTADDVTTSTTTSGDGDYLFSDIPEGDYIVRVAGGLPGGVVNTFDADDGINNPDGQSTLTLDDSDLGQDFGYVGTGSIGDSIFLDANGNGTPDAGEGISGIDVSVTYLGPDGVLGTDDDVVFETTTDSDGTYNVSGLPAGEYAITVDTGDLPAGVQPTVDPDGGNDSASSVTLAPGETNDDQDFGYAPLGSIGDTVYLDGNGNGVQDDDEDGIAGVSVTLTEPGPDGVLGTDDDTTQTDTTDDNGEYSFDDLLAGDYAVTVTGGLPDSANNTGDPDGAAVGDGDSTSNVTLAPGEDNEDQDFGYQPVGSILGDRVWLDLNADGVQDDGEPGINGVTVQATFAGDDGILGTADDVVETTTTSGDGDYLFTDLTDGDYRVEILDGVPSDLAPTFDDDGGFDEASETTLAGIDLQQDFGYAATGSIGDSIFLDSNGNGTPDDGEGIPNVDGTVTYLGPDGVLGTDDDIVFETTTDGDGNYSVDGLPAGDYVVAVDTDDLPDGVAPSVDPDGGDDSTSSVTLAPGETNDDQDFGYAGTGSIGDTVFLDRDNDGEQNILSDPGIEGVTVTLTEPGPDGVLGTDDDTEQTTTTDENGNYLFENLPAGDYQVTVSGAVPDELANTRDPDGGADSSSTVDSSAAGVIRASDVGTCGCASDCSF